MYAGKMSVRDRKRQEIIYVVKSDKKIQNSLRCRKKGRERQRGVSYNVDKFDLYQFPLSVQPRRSRSRLRK